MNNNASGTSPTLPDCHFFACAKDTGEKLAFIKMYILPLQDTQSSTSSFYSHTIQADLVLKERLVCQRKMPSCGFELCLRMLKMQTHPHW